MGLLSSLEKLGKVAEKGLGAVTGALGINSKENADYQNEFAEYMLRLQRQWQLDDRDFNNLYNTPSKQLERWRAAGFNPYMAMGNLDAGSSTMQSSPTPVSSADPTNSVFASLLNTGISTAVGIPLSVAQAKNMNANTGLTNLKMDELRTENKYRSQRIESELTNLKNQGKLTLSQYRSQQLANKLQTEVYDDSVAKFKSESRLADANAKAQEFMAQQEEQRVQLAQEMVSQARAETQFQAQRFSADLKVLASQIDLNRAGAAAQFAHAAESIARRNGILWDNKLKVRTFHFAIRQQQAMAQESEARSYIENATRDYQIRESKYSARQKKMDYYNPFKYMSGSLSGVGLNAAKLFRYVK